jgi:SAM-dependent methyltransferase
MTAAVTLTGDYFDAMYAESDDPWGFQSRWYERRKYAISLATLPAPRYRAAFEPACSIGVMTEQLAGRCDQVLACDRAPAAVQAARARTAGLPHVRIEQRVLPDAWPEPEESFDLIVFSEFLYYFADADLGQLLSRARESLVPGGTLLAVHWRHPVAEHPRGGDEVHAILARQPGLAKLASHCEEDFLAEVYLRGDGPAVSVAAATGLL